MSANGLASNGHSERDDKQVKATFRFCHPDNSIPGKDRGMFSFPANKEVKEIELPLHDYRTDPSITRGPAGLDIDGFTLVNHQSSLQTDEEWLDEKIIHDRYLPEVIELLKKTTGAKEAIVNNVFHRRKLVELQKDKDWVLEKDGDFDKFVKTLPTDRLTQGASKADASLEPARGVHVDYSLEGLLSVVRYGRKDILAAGKAALDEVDRQNGANGTNGPRIAAYTVWRPIKTVHRDPLAVAKYGSVPQSDFCAIDYRAPGDIPKDKEYLLEAYMLKPPQDPQRQRWYWAPEQRKDEVWIVKFADTLAARADGAYEWKEGVAASTPHCSPALQNIADDVETRESIEVRILAFW